METTPPFPFSPGQRVLAAIVFTDAVGFSARAHTHEVATLHRLDHDFDIIRSICGNYSGTVLKSTGDGLLMYFTSGVQAVSCAVDIQRRFESRRKAAPSEEHMMHRIGVHLGDVFVTSNDVMGDGVNIAARLMSEAPVGGVLISQTVYDVVKHKLDIHSVCLGARSLKNIKEPILVYRVLLEAPATILPAVAPLPVAPAGSPAAKASADPEETPPAAGRKIGVALAVAAALAAGAWYAVREHSAKKEELARSQAAQAALTEMLKTKDNPPEPVVESADTPPKARDFGTLVGNSPATATPGDEDSEAAVREAREAVSVLMDWLHPELKRYTKDRPLPVRTSAAATSLRTMVFTDSSQQLFFAEGGAVRRRDWASLRPDVQGAIIASALTESPGRAAPEVITGAEAFAYLHGLPSLLDAVRRSR